MALVVVASYPASAKTDAAASSSWAMRRSPRAWRRGWDGSVRYLGRHLYQGLYLCLDRGRGRGRGLYLCLDRGRSCWRYLRYSVD